MRVETADNEGALARMNLKAHHTVDSTSLIERNTAIQPQSKGL